MEYVKADELPFCPRAQISALVVDAYYDLFKFFENDLPAIKVILAQS